MENILNAFRQFVVNAPAFTIVTMILFFGIHFTTDLWITIKNIVAHFDNKTDKFKDEPLDSPSLWSSNFKRLLNYNSWKIFEIKYQEGQGMVIICKHTDTNGKLFEISLNKEYQITHIRQIDNG